MAVRAGAVLVVLAPAGGAAGAAPWELEERAAWLLWQVFRACGAQLEVELAVLERLLEGAGEGYTAESALESPGAAGTAAGEQGLLSRALRAAVEDALDRAAAEPRRMGGVLEPSRWPAPAVAAFLFRQGGAGVEEIGRRPSAGGLILGPAAGTAWDAVREGALAVLRPPGCSSHDEEGEGTEEGEERLEGVLVKLPGPGGDIKAALEATVVPLHHMPGTCAVVYHASCPGGLLAEL